MAGNKKDPPKEKTDTVFPNQTHYEAVKSPTILLEANKLPQKDILVGFLSVLGVMMQ